MEALTPLLAQLGIGGVGGFLVGYAVKRIAKLVAVLLGVGFVLLQYLAYRGVIQLNYEDLLLHAQRLVSRFAWEGLLPLLLANLPFAGSFSVGLLLGLRKG
ncbi:TPA: hypothetical protein EYP44_05630 [Candidatus Bathyarchaeota archaeon]|nr:hypothetical protein [Candidatus Bathyarchaeota archaeon]